MVDNMNNTDDGVENDVASDVGEAETELYSMIPLRDLVVFPGTSIPLKIGRMCSIAVIDELPASAHVVLLTQKDETSDDPVASTDDFYDIGVLAEVRRHHILKLPQGIIKVVVDIIERVKVVKIVKSASSSNSNTKIYKVLVRKFMQENDEDSESKSYKGAIAKTLLDSFKEYVENSDKLTQDLIAKLNEIEDLSVLSDVIVSHLPVDSLKLLERQKLLECVDHVKRAEIVCGLIEDNIKILKAERKIKDRVKKQMDGAHTKYYLCEQLKAIQKELNQYEGGASGVGEFNEIEELEKKVKSLDLSEAAREKAYEEIRKLKMMNPVAAEATVVRSYLDWLLNVPWNELSRSKVSLKKAKSILNANHYGMSKVKERIMEYLAVQQMVGKVKGSVLCLLGPPGVGKTSLVKSIADSMGRPFVKISLGGVRDESEIRGHRRTYIGSMPGKIIQGMKKAKCSNPLMLLDEIDKMGSDFRGDPAAAMLEVLDDEQNANFADHYLEVDYDLSHVVFIATSNTTNIPYALLDRLEIIRVSGYTENEKYNIVNQYLLNRVRHDHGLSTEEFTVSKGAVINLIRSYTRESGVRGLKRELEKLARKSVYDIVSKKIKKSMITANNLHRYAGVPKYMFGEVSENDAVGVVTGLAYTEVGGELLTIEAVILPGQGKIKSTGKLGEVMQESVHAAYSYIISRCWSYTITPSHYAKHDVHVHVPEGAIPKDGPSAGVAMSAAILSILTGIPIRKDIAMTGEVTLSGRVLPIGGLKEKLLAALRAGIKIVLIPKKNKKDLVEMPDNVINDLDIKLVDNVDEVFKYTLVRMPKPIALSDRVDPKKDTDDTINSSKKDNSSVSDEDFEGMPPVVN